MGMHLFTPARSRRRFARSHSIASLVAARTPRAAARAAARGPRGAEAASGFEKSRVLKISSPRELLAERWGEGEGGRGGLL